MQPRLPRRQASDLAPPPLDADTYIHSPAHHAVARKDHADLRRIVLGLPTLAAAESVRTESDAFAEEAKAEALSAVLDSRDVPGRETPLHLAVRLGDSVAADILMSAGADCSLQNENGWSSLQEAICARQEAIARIIVRYYQPSGWAKWRRRLPLIVAVMNRMRDFYMEVSFNFESSVIPLVSRVAPSDTYHIWKRGSNLRTDMTLSGFDGFKIQRSGQTVLFLGEGSEDGRLQEGSLCVLDHKTREISNALDGADKDLTEREVAQEVSLMAQTNLYRPGIDVTQAHLVPQLSWTWQEKVEFVYGWKAKVYEMQNVIVSVKSRQVPGAMSDEEFLQSLPSFRRSDDGAEEDYAGTVKGKDSKKHTDKASTSRTIRSKDDSRHRSKIQEAKVDSPALTAIGSRSLSNVEDRREWGGRTRQTVHQEASVTRTPPGKPYSSEMKVSKFPGHVDGGEQVMNKSRRFMDTQHRAERELEDASKHMNERKSRSATLGKPTSNIVGKESEFKKGLRPVLWLTPDFPLKTEELLPLLDILANKVKAIRRLRELLTTKLPPGTFPVKIAFPVIPTIRVVVTFSRFVELGSDEDFQALSSLVLGGSQDEYFQSSWLSWIKGPATKPTESYTQGCLAESGDPFAIPKDYKWNKPVVQKARKIATKN